MDDAPETAHRSAHRRGEDHPQPITPRAVGRLMLLWTIVLTGWFASVAANSTVQTVTLALAVAGLFGVIWLLGLLILGLFMASHG